MYNQKTATAALRGAQNRNSGNYFEQIIEAACTQYLRLGIARIEKTPEPFQVTQQLSGGKFSGYFKSQAQPDFKGCLSGGRTIVFDAKHTDTAKIELSRLTDEQIKALEDYEKLGAFAAVLISFGFRRFALIPYGVFMNAKKENGHKYWTADEAEPWSVRLAGGYVDFLQKGNGKCITK